MRKILISLGALLLTVGIAQASLWDYYQEQGQELPSVSDRVLVAENCGISDYTGTYEQNIALEDCLRSGSLLGVVIPDISALFETSLQNSIASDATSMTLVSATLANGDSLSGTYGFIIDEGSANEEFVICSASGTALTSCLRGIDPVDGQTEVASLKDSHRRGASVKITDFPILGVMRKILTGEYTLPNSLQYASSTSISNMGLNTVTTKYYVDNVGAGGFTSLNIGDGNTLRANGTSPETLDIATSTDNWWFNINSDGYFALSTTTNKGIDTFWSDRYNATTTKGGDFTFSDNLTVSGDTTITGSLSALNIDDGVDYKYFTFGEAVSSGDAVGFATSTESTTEISSTNDAKVDDDNPDTNYGSETTAVIGYVGDDANNKFYFQIDTPIMSDAVFLQDVIVSVYISASSGTIQDLSATCYNPNTFDEDTLTWNNRPNNGRGAIGGIEPAVGWLEFDFPSDTLNGCIASSTNSLVFSIQSNGSNTQTATIETSENASGRAPKLTYHKWIDIDDKLYRTDASYATTTNMFMGFAKEDYSADESGYVAIDGVFTNSNLSLTPAYEYFLSNTIGGISTSAGTNSYSVGRAVSSTSIMINK